MGNNVFCIYCANIFEAQLKDTYLCPYCSNHVDKQLYAQLLSHANDAVYYGYNYRNAYEEQLDKFGEIRVRYSLLSPQNIYEFLAVAVIAGLTYDAIKTIAFKLRDFIKRNNKEKEHRDFIYLITHEEKLLKFTTYLQDYQSGMQKVDGRIKKEIEEEVFININSKKLTGLLQTGKIEDIGVEGFRKCFQDSLDEIESKPSLSSKVLERLFKEIEDI